MSSPTTNTQKTAAVLGATGNCGQALVKVLSSSPEWSSITAVSRRKLAEFDALPKVTQQVVRMDTDTDFEKDVSDLFSSNEAPDACFCTMGVGQPRKVASSDLERVDCTLPTLFAKAAASAGVKHATLLSAVGSNINSKLNFSAVGGSAWASYAQIKGQVEQNYTDEKFHSVTLVRPAGLLGNTNTPMQGMLRGTSFLMPTRYKPIEIVDLAKAMSAQALDALDNNNETNERPTILEGASLFGWVDKAKAIMSGGTAE